MVLPADFFILFYLTFGAALVCFWLVYKNNSRARHFPKYIEVDSISGLPFGIPVIVRGEARVHKNPLIGPASQQECVYCRYFLQTYVELINSKGTPSYQWVLQGEPLADAIPFFLKDETGEVFVNATEAIIEPDHITDRYLTGNERLGIPAEVSTHIPHTEMPLRLHEEAVYTGEFVNVYGVVALQGDTRVLQETKEYPMLVTTRSREQVIKNNLAWARVVLIMGCVLLILSVVFFVGMLQEHSISELIYNYCRFK